MAGYEFEPGQKVETRYGSRWMPRTVRALTSNMVTFEEGGFADKTRVRPVPEVRPLAVIAQDILDHWASVYFGAVPYLEAMGRLDKITDMYGADDAESIVMYFLSNATGWRGPDARRIKAELKSMLKAAK